ncbi:MAG: hypothetical protein MRERV_25c014 [Mycoplasmataceae bacterium RV_VA103A]|nr:MAG: hypothetical protein MRERV_25c014 [Mycoplasmataceae bacterium RV_VA103A]
MNWNKISKKDIKNLGQIPTEASPNLKMLDDKRFTGRKVRVSFTCRPEFAAELKRAAALNNCYQIELLEKAWEYYKQQQNITV